MKGWVPGLDVDDCVLRSRSCVCVGGGRLILLRVHACCCSVAVRGGVVLRRRGGGGCGPRGAAPPARAAATRVDGVPPPLRGLRLGGVRHRAWVRVERRVRAARERDGGRAHQRRGCRR